MKMFVSSHVASAALPPAVFRLSGWHPRQFALRLLLFAGLLSTALYVKSQTEEKKNRFSLDLHIMTRGEIRDGGMVTSEEETDDRANFALSRERLIVGYENLRLKRDSSDMEPWLQMNLNVQHQGVWGQSGKGAFNVHEGWARLTARNGLFAQVGRQILAYDDERIIGPNDWSMAGISHDALKVGYEGHGHSVHGIFSYNQNAENVSGGTYYANGAQPYKMMETVWYHYDVPKIPLGASLLFMNLGMQGGEKGKNERTEWQQVLGGYVKYDTKKWSLEGSYYRQMGHNEEGIRIKAWMVSVKGTVNPSPIYGFEMGYDHLSGDKLFAVPPKGGFGLVKHNVIKGFNPIYGSHHKFYGAMDFFYVTTYVNGFTPGLQNAFVGGYVKPLKGLKIGLSYHYLAMSTKLIEMKKSLGHELELGISYQIIKQVNVSAGFSFMKGTRTMEQLKRISGDGSLKWGWLSLNITPRIFSTRW